MVVVLAQLPLPPVDAAEAGAAPAPALKVDILIDGVTGPVLENVRSSLSLEQQKDSARLSVARMRALHKRAPDEIRTALRVFGYYQPQIQSSLEQQGDLWQARYTIEPGPAVTLTRIEVKVAGAGERDGVFEKFISTFPLKVGERLEDAAYEKAKQRLLQIASTRGYFDARLSRHEVRVDAKRHQAEIFLTLESGARYRFGAVSYSDVPLNGSLLRKFQPFKEGEPYSNALLTLLQQKLIGSGYFSQVEVEPLHGQAAARTIPIRVGLVMSKRHLYKAGIGFGTDTGPRLVASYEARYLNRRGHRFAAQTRISPVLSTAKAGYKLPYIGQRGGEIGINGGLSYEDTSTARSSSASFGASYRSLHWGWDEVLSLDYQIEQSDIGTQSVIFHGLIPGISWHRQSSDAPIYPRHGWQLNLDLHGADSALGSNISFARMWLSGKYLQGLGTHGRLLTRAEFGTLLSSRFSELPASQRFFAGGDNSIRGFDLNALGPRDALGKVIGGRYLVVGSVEYEHMIHGPWGAAIFSDFGNAFDKLSDPFVFSVGAGLRWHSPIGPVRIDVAAGVSEADLPIRLHIIIGPYL